MVFQAISHFVKNILSKTAAHCVEGEPQNAILIVAGTIYLNTGGARHQSLRYIMHPLYDDYTLEYE